MAADRCQLRGGFITGDVIKWRDPVWSFWMTIHICSLPMLGVNIRLSI